MVKIYLDNNVYRWLNLPEQMDVLSLLKKMINRDVMILYSQAHLNDLHQDKTDQKEADLRFMESLAEDNFLMHESETDSIVNKLVNPVEAYSYFKPRDASYEELFTEIFADLEAEQDLGLLNKSMIDLLKNTPMDIGVSSIKKEDDPKNIISRLGLDNNPNSLYDWMFVFGRMMDKLHSDNTIIKDVRTTSKSILGVEKFSINIEQVDFDKRLSETPLGMSYLKLLESTVENMSNAEKKNFRYMYFTMAFTMLNFMGVDSEKNKKVKFKNTQHDAEHYFYSLVSDWVISDDKGFLNKSKFLNNLFHIDTEVLTTRQFRARLFFLLGESKQSFESFLVDAMEELKNGFVLNTELSIDLLQKITIIKPNKILFGFFNRISFNELTDGSDHKYVILYKDGRKIQHYSWYKDFERMTNKIVELIGCDSFGLGSFSESDREDLLKEEWDGREWNIDGRKYILSQNSLSRRLNFSIGPFFGNINARKIR